MYICSFACQRAGMGVFRLKHNLSKIFKPYNKRNRLVYNNNFLLFLLAVVVVGNDNHEMIPCVVLVLHGKWKWRWMKNKTLILKHSCSKWNQIKKCEKIKQWMEWGKKVWSSFFVVVWCDVMLCAIDVGLCIRRKLSAK